MRCRFVSILYLAAASVLLIGCSRHEVSGSYIAKFTNGIYWLQLVETPDRHLTGQFDTLVLGTDGKVAYDNLSVTGAADGDKISVLLKPISLLPFTVTASGALDGDKLTLSGGFTGGQPSTVVLVRTEASEYQAQVKAINTQSQRILAAKAEADARENAAQQKRNRIAKLGQLVSEMEHFSAVVNAQIKKPWVEKRYHDITSRMQEYLKAQRQLVNNPGASFKRSQISYAIDQGVFATDQVHNGVQSDQGYFTANVEPLMKQATEAERGCELAHNPNSGNSASPEAEAENSACLRLLNAFPIFKRTYDAKAGHLSHLEEVYQQQKQLQLESQQAR